MASGYCCGPTTGWLVHKTHVGAGLLANAQCQSMDRATDSPRSRASPLPHKPAHTERFVPVYSALQSARQLSSIRLEKPHSLSYQASTLSNLPLTLV